MKLLRNLSFITMVVAWAATGTMPVAALVDMEACSMSCNSPTDECCFVGNPQSQPSFSCDSYCGGCPEIPGSGSDNGSCSAYDQGQYLAEGFICRCELLE